MLASNNTVKRIAYIYLLVLPALVTAFAFIIGHVSYMIYIPVWMLNLVIMTMATKTLLNWQGQFAKIDTAFLIFPWMLFAIFGGMGPPPETAGKWALQATEQVFRYSFLIIGGISMFIGFYRLNKLLAPTRAMGYAKVSTILMKIALPLFILNMVYWGYFLTYTFITYSGSGAPAKPMWMKPFDEIFTIIRMIEVASLYLSTAALAIALRLTRQISNTGSHLYVAFAILGAVLNLLPDTITGPLAIAHYLSYIPAFTMLMPYLIAVNLLIKRVNYEVSYF